MIAALSMPGVDVDLARVLHGGQSLRVHRPLPVRAAATRTDRITAVHDKGKAAVLVLRSDAADADGPLWTAEAQVYVRGEGGWGGERGPSAGAAEEQGAPTSRSSVPYGRTRRCSTASPATSTPSTPTRSSRAAPVSTAPAARTVHLRHDPQGGRRHAPRRRRHPRPLLDRAVRRSDVPGETLRIRMWRGDGAVRVAVGAVERGDAPVLAGATVEFTDG